MRNKLILLSALILLPAQAHEGHDHDAPVTIKAPKGGMIKALDIALVEVVSKGKDIKVYVYDQELKPRPAATFTIVAKAEMPRTKKVEPVSLVDKGEWFEGSFDAKGVHRYTLRLAVTDQKTGRTDPISFIIEPRK